MARGRGGGRTAHGRTAAGGRGIAASPQSSRWLSRRDTEERAERALGNQFPSATLAQVKQIEVDGSTALKKTADEIRRLRSQRGPKARISPSFWAELRRKHLLAQAATASELCVPSAKAAAATAANKPDPELEHALEEAKAQTVTAASRKRLLRWLHSGNGLARQECWAVLNHIKFFERPTSSAVSVDVCMAIARRIRRGGQEADFSAELAARSDVFDAALAAKWAAVRKAPGDRTK